MRALTLPAIMSLILLAFPARGAEQTYKFSVVPQQPATVLLKRWGPILRYVSTKLGHRLVFRTAPNIPTFEKRLRTGKYDLAYMNPVHYTVFALDPGYRAFAKQKGKRIRGILVVRQDSRIKELTELVGQTLAFPAPAAFAASVLPRGFLTQQRIAVTPKYVGNHDSVYRDVAKGLYPAGGGIQRTLGVLAPKIRGQLRVLWTSNSYTAHAFAAHPRVPVEVVAEVQTLLIGMFDDPTTRGLMQAIGFKQGVEFARDSDWDDVRGLGITRLPQRRF